MVQFPAAPAGVKKFLLLSLPALGVVVLVVFLYYRTYTASIDYVIEQNEKQNIELQARSIYNQFHPLLRDLAYLSRVENLLNIQGGRYGLEEIPRLTGIYTSFLRRKGEYNQVRFIDGEGKEVLRVVYDEGDARAVFPDKPRNRKETDYFLETAALEEGMVYVSPVEADTEHEKTEAFIPPVIRLAAPVYNSGKLLGIVVLDYNARHIFDEVRGGAEYSYGRHFLINPDSYWFYDPAEKERWEFSIGKDNKELASQFPYLDLERIRNEAGGSFYTPGGLLTFATVSLPENAGHEWKLLSCVPSEVFREEYTAGRRRAVITSLLAGCAVFGMMFFLSLNRRRRLAAEEELREEASIFSGNPAPVLKITGEKIIAAANPAAAVLFRQEVLGKNIDEFLPGFELAYWKYTSGEQFIQFEETINEQTYLFTLNPESIDTEGSVIIYGTDISSRKQIELELAKLSKAVDQSANTIVITDTKGTITFANKAFEKTTGYSIEEVLGQNPKILKSGTQPEAVYKDLWETLQTGGAWHGEFLNRRKDGSTYWEDAVISPVRDNNGRVVSYLAVKEDITQRKIAEEALKSAKEDAEIANRLKSEFLANMSHEIRTPMNAVIGFTDLLLDETKDPEQREKLEIIKKSGQNLLNLINDILDFSKIEAGKVEIEHQIFNLERTLDHIKTMYDIVADEKGLTFSLEREESVPLLVYGDELRLNQVLINVVSNAFKFTEKGFVAVTCRYEAPELVIEVADSGVGIEESKLTSIFSAFEQADSSTERRYGGTGLGLAISRRLARLMGGDIDVVSTPAKGTTFTVRAQFPPAGAGQPAAAPDRQRESVRREAGEQMVRSWLRQMENDKEMEAILYEGIRELPNKLRKLEDAVVKNRERDIRFIAHDLKGFSGNLNMSEIYEKARAVNDEIDKDNYSITFIRRVTEDLRLLVDSIPTDYLTRKRVGRLDLAKLKSDYAILLAEDNEINQRLIKTYLKGTNLQCDIAPNGKIALEKLKNKKYDLLLLDMQMPVLDGEEVIARVRRDEKFTELYVIALTAHAMKGDAEKYINLGCNDYLSKPVDRNLLYEKIQKHIIRVNKQMPEEEMPEEINASLAEAVSSYTEDVRILVSELEETVKIFNPEKIGKLAEGFTRVSADEEFVLLEKELKKAAESFDEGAVTRVLGTLRAILDRQGDD